MDNKLDVIRYVGDNDVIVYRDHIENFNTKSRLIVEESQEALFFKDGQALDLFPSGSFPLTTDNVPLIKKIFNKIFSRDATPFQCEVFFINKVNVCDILWGTDYPIAVEDPKYNLIVNVRSNGQMGIRVVDSRKFVVKIAGQLSAFTVQDVKRSIKGALLSVIKDVLAKAIIESKYSILEIQSHLLDLSKAAVEKLNEYIADMGLEAVHFYIGTINCPDEDIAKLKQMREKRLEAMTELDIEYMKTVKMGEAKAEARRSQGFTYQDERKYDVLEGAAKNEGNGAASTFMGAGIGLGMGAGIGAGIGQAASNVGQAMQQNAAPAANNDQVACPNCKTLVPKGSKFCSSCGSPIPQEQPKKFCTECGAQIEGNAKFCPNCGHKF